MPSAQLSLFSLIAYVCLPAYLFTFGWRGVYSREHVRMSEDNLWSESVLSTHHMDSWYQNQVIRLDRRYLYLPSHLPVLPSPLYIVQNLLLREWSHPQLDKSSYVSLIQKFLTNKFLF